MGICNKKLHAVNSYSRNTPKLSIPYAPSLKSVLDYYKFGPIIGLGTFGKVRLGTSLASGFKVAIKSIDKKKFHREIELTQFKRELEILFSLDHPNLITFIQSFDSSRYLHIVTEYCEGGDLCQYVLQSEGVSEEEASRVIVQVLRAVQYLHQNSICHRDIKAENFLFVSSEPGSDLKLIDFGLSKKFGDRTKMNTFAGTPRYLAPEIQQKTMYDYKCDLWSIGVLLYFMLTGSFPFAGDQSLVSVGDGEEYKLEGEEWDQISDPAKDLIQNLLVPTPEVRFDTQQALNHPWLVNRRSTKRLSLNASVVKSLKLFHPKTKLQREALQVIVKFINTQEIKDLKDTFIKIDIANTGFLTRKQVEEALRGVDTSLKKSDVKNTIEDLDFHDDGRIKYSDFIAATLTSRVVISEELIKSAFAHFDVDNTGFITAENLVVAFSNNGYLISNDEVIELIKEVDVEEKSGRISYQEFRNAVLG